MIDNTRERRKDKIDVHWKIFYESCLPRHIKYDFIGKLETVRKDTECLMPRITDTPFKFPESGAHGPSSLHLDGGKNTLDLVYDFLHNQLTREQLLGILKVYELDCTMFGFNCLEL